MDHFDDHNARRLTEIGFECVESFQAQFAGFIPNFAYISLPECQRRRCVIGHLSFTDDLSNLALVTDSPLDFYSQQVFEEVLLRLSPSHLRRIAIQSDELDSLFSKAEVSERAMDGVLLSASKEEQGQDFSDAVLELSLASIETTENPTVKLVDSTLYDALRLGASDIHFEVQQKVLHIKYRLDGVLQHIRRVDSSEMSTQVISRIKVLADLDISERRIPQDGRFKVLLDQREIDFRVSIMPNIASEDAVLRILDRKHLTGQFSSLTLDSLNLDESVKEFVRKVSRLPYGLLLVTGPTGSGKTTTLYAALTEINTGLDKIVTIEDPIEYQLNGVLQIPVNEKKGLTFAKGLRSILRHDPDKIMVGEIRDSETAQIAVQAALTGHQVFTTIHANNVFDVNGRFANMGVDSYSFVAALTGIMAQRLVRSVCPHCAENIDIDAAIRSSLGDIDVGEVLQIKKACGCSLCRHTGYKGRVTIAESLAINDAMKDMLARQAPISEVKALAKSQGFRSLRDSAVSLVLQGVTTLEEINRVTPVQ